MGVNQNQQSLENEINNLREENSNLLRELELKRMQIDTFESRMEKINKSMLNNTVSKIEVLKNDVNRNFNIENSKFHSLTIDHQNQKNNEINNDLINNTFDLKLIPSFKDINQMNFQYKPDNDNLSIDTSNLKNRDILRDKIRKKIN